ncbi:hypothetical protein IGG50_004225 [Escherichia coli]|nr:hypothetical protein [Escherichia coli]
MRKLWNALRRPSARWSVLALVAIGIVIGIALIVLPHVGIKVTSVLIHLKYEKNREDIGLFGIWRD